MPRVRLIDVEGEQVGLKTRDEALEYAWGKNLDLVEVAPDANPPVCRVMDYSKYKYEQEQKQKLARKHQSTITIKEIKLRPKIDPHDYETKKGHVLRFLKNRDKVKVTIMFRGREMYHPERGRSLLLRLADDVKDLAVIEADPLQDGRNMVMMLAPHKEAVAAKPANEAGDTEATEAIPRPNTSPRPSLSRPRSPSKSPRRPPRPPSRKYKLPSLQPDPSMPKQKTHSGAKKRFKITGTGKLMRRHGMKSHILEKKSPKRKQAFRRDQSVSAADTPMVERLLGRR